MIAGTHPSALPTGGEASLEIGAIRFEHRAVIGVLSRLRLPKQGLDRAQASAQFTLGYRATLRVQAPALY